MSRLAGTGTLLRSALRRDRVVLPLWVAGIAGTVVLTATSLRDLYPTAADRLAFARGIGDNPALIAIRGPARALDTLGGEIAWQIGWFAAILAALMSLLLVVRHTRGDEETGRTELLLAAPAGRHAPGAAALVLVAGADAVVAAAIAGGLVAIGLPVAGSLALGASVGAAGLVFAGVAAVTAQLTEGARAATGLAASALGAAYVLRAIGDVGDGTLSWLSPLGWSQAARPFTGERWWPLLLALAAALVLVAAAVALLARRDLGAGLLPSRPGPAGASPGLTRPLGFALRLQRGALAGWGAGLVALGFAYGSLGENVRDLLETSPKVADFFSRAGGGSIVDAFFATACLIVALLGTGFTVQATLRLRAEETAGRAEPVLATALGRVRWAAGHAALAMAGTALLLALAGAGMGLAYGLRGAGLDEVPRLAAAALVQAPAAWVLGGLALALFGLAPRATAAAWAALAYCLAIGLLGPLLGLPEGLDEASPFAHVPQLPAQDLSVLPLLGLTALAAALATLGLAGFQRRDAG